MRVHAVRERYWSRDPNGQRSLTSLTRTNSFGLRIQGTVQDAAGQSYRLNAELHDLIFPDGSFKRVVQNVNLNPVGNP